MDREIESSNFPPKAQDVDSQGYISDSDRRLKKRSRDNDIEDSLNDDYKAKKGHPVHVCELCEEPRVFTRAEHLRRHQLSHEQAKLPCTWPDCEKVFHRPDLLSRHISRHEIQGDGPYRTSDYKPIDSKRRSRSSSICSNPRTPPQKYSPQQANMNAPNSNYTSPHILAPTGSAGANMRLAKDYEPIMGYGYRQQKKQPRSLPLPTGKAAPQLACPFRKHNWRKFNLSDYQSCALGSFNTITHVKDHIYKRHAVQIMCSRCGLAFDTQDDLKTHQSGEVMCKIELQQTLVDSLTPETLSALRRQRKHRSQTIAEQWQGMYQVLFPNDDRIMSPYFEPVIDNHNLVPQTHPLNTFEAGYTLEQSKSSKSFRYGSDHKPQIGMYHDPSQEDCYNSYRIELSPLENPLGERILQINVNISSAFTRGDKVEKTTIEKNAKHSVCNNAPPATSATAADSNVSSCSSYASSLQSIRTPTAISPLPTSKGYSQEPPSLNSIESPSNASGQSTELYEEDEDEQLSNDDSIYIGSRTSSVLDPMKQALFNHSMREFWNFYNKFSSFDWISLWLKHGGYRNATSSTNETQKSTYTARDTQISSNCPSNGRLLPSKRQVGDDGDDTDNNERHSKRHNNTLLQKESLELACPFHKYKPQKYNHGFLRFRTCSITSFKSIYRLKEHLRRVHSPPIYCPRCSLSFIDQNSLINHAKSEIPCQAKPELTIEAWTIEMAKKITKSKDETERGCWERIYRELFNVSLSDIPSPYFVPYNLMISNDTDLVDLLLQEMPQRSENMFSEITNNMDGAEAARTLFDTPALKRLARSWTENAMREIIAEYRSSAAATSSPAVPLTPQSLLGTQSITTRGRSVLRPTRLQPRSQGSSQSAHHSGAIEPSTEITQRSNTTVQLISNRGSLHSGRISEQPPTRTPGPAPVIEETVSTSSHHRPPIGLQYEERPVQQVDCDEIDDFTATFGEAIRQEGVLTDFDFDAFLEDDDDSAFPGL